MNTPPSPLGAERTGESAVRIGALVPLTRPGWVEAGEQLLGGFVLVVCVVAVAGGFCGGLAPWWLRAGEVFRLWPGRPSVDQPRCLGPPARVVFRLRPGNRSSPNG